MSETIITTYSGRHIDLLTPESADIHIDDIAHALCHQNRFAGHTQRPYSVGEHLLLGLEFCEPAVRFRWFTHDFSEAYLGDVTGPLKRTSGMRFYRELEAAWESALASRFGIPGEGGKQVRLLDRRMLLTEQRDLVGRQPVSTDGCAPFPLHLAAHAPSPEWLKDRFLREFYRLAKETEGARI